jgi:hypothetical protein
MIEAFIRERGVTQCPPRIVDGNSRSSARGQETPNCFLFREVTEARTPEQKLAVAKILQMLQDLAGKSHVARNEEGVIRWRAENWFFGPSDLAQWCEMAGYRPEVVRQKARDILQNGWPQWRAAAGTGARYEERKAFRARSRQRGFQ